MPAEGLKTGLGRAEQLTGLVHLPSPGREYGKVGVVFHDGFPVPLGKVDSEGLDEVGRRSHEVAPLAGGAHQ